jgi:hypothetical protein
MKKITHSLNLITLCAVLMSTQAFAYDAGDTKERCFPPKFKSFSPPEKTPNTPVPEVDPGSEISFTVSGSADIESISAVAKDIPLQLNIEDKQSFYKVSANLPTELNGKFARIHLKATAMKGECDKQDGWLIKIRPQAQVAAENSPNTEETQETAASEPVSDESK